MGAHRSAHEEEKRVLMNIFSNPHADAHHIHLHGTSASGIIESLQLMEIAEARIVFINCLSIEGCTKNLLSRISKGLRLKHSKCDNVESLQHDLNRLCCDKKERLVCILLEAHALNAFTSAFLKALFDVARKTPNGRLSFVTVSHVSWLDIQREINSCATEPISMRFNSPSNEEMVETISSKTKISVQFVKICVDHLIPTSNNPNVIENLVEKAWIDVDSEVWNTPSGVKKIVQILDQNKKQNGSDWLDSSSSLLSTASKLFLVASFLASHNHPSSDKRYFIKTHNKEKVKANQKRNESAGIPKMFDLERLLFIREALIQLYTHLRNDSIGIEPKLLVNSLVSMNRIVLISSKENIDWPKLKCVTPLETVRQLAVDIGIPDIKDHLEY
ncbi:hypothetical protein PMAYCL1PPCAC_18354 [Pristionchus mayeri]|uniref:Origin recognition complex subunit 5 C-terminal domain-containing protein n=1 Tax=Pristionchus mayeri TaxID=1317129 RepID=A0AAN5CPR2_9BILA|nr:hypothetical protein PMAYCL1PPCAC_18354 [Pristionchus mayeri]